MTQPNVNLEVRLEDGTVAQGTFANTPNAPTAGAMGLVWRPGGVFGPGVVTTWAEVAAAVAASPVPLWVWVDSSIAAAVIPGSSGTTDMRGTTRLLSFNWSTASISYTDMVEIQDGATLYRLREIAEGLDVLCDAVTTASLSFEGPPTIDVFTVRDFARLRTGGSAAVAAIELGAGQSLQFYTRGNVQVEALTASGLFSLTSTSILNWTAFDQLTVNVYASVLITGPAGARFNFIHDLSTLPGLPTALTGFSGTFYDDRLFPAPGTAPYNPAWFALTDVYWDPGNSTGLASDENSGASATAPLLTWGQIVQRYGSTQPQFNYGQSVTFHVMSAQPAGQDPVFFEPRVSGGGQAILSALSYLATAGASFLAGALSGGYGYAGAAPSAGGVEMTMAGVPGYVVANVLLYNATRASYAFVDAVAGGNATLTQPQTAATLTSTATIPDPVTADNDWVAGDTIDAYVCTAVNLKRWSPYGIDVAGTKPCSGWVFGVQIVDSSGTGLSTYAHAAKCICNVLSLCVVSTRLDLSGEISRDKSVYLLGCAVVGQLIAVASNSNLWGGVLKGGLTAIGGFHYLNNNIVIHSAVLAEGGSTIEVGVVGAFADGAWEAYSAGTLWALGFFWGSYSLTMAPGGLFYNDTGSTFVLKATLTSGALSLDGATGSYYTPGTGLWTGGVAVTPANIDANDGLQNPITGARFCNST